MALGKEAAYGVRDLLDGPVLVQGRVGGVHLVENRPEPRRQVVHVEQPRGCLFLLRRDRGRESLRVRIFHIALRFEWEDARRTGTYTTSTRGRTLAEEGFIHASRADQWEGVRDAFYADVTEPLVLLEIDAALLTVPVVEEPPAEGVEETFPHVYGPINADAVVDVTPL